MKVRYDMQLKKHFTKLAWAIAAGVALTAPGRAVLAQPESRPQNTGNFARVAPAQDDPANAAESQSATLQDVEVVRGEAGVKIQIKISPAVKPTVMTLAGPDRLVFDFGNTVSASSRSRIEVNRDGVTAVRIGVQAGTPPVTRVVFDLAGPRSYELAMSGSAVTVSLGSPEPAATPASASDSQAQPQPAASPAEQPTTDTSHQTPGPSPTTSSASPVADPVTPTPAPAQTDPGAAIAGAGDTPAAPAADLATAKPSAESKRSDSTRASGAPEAPTTAQASSQENAGSNPPPQAAAPAPEAAPPQKVEETQPAAAPASGEPKEQSDVRHPGNAFFSLSRAQSNETVPAVPNTQGVEPVSQSNPKEAKLLAEAAPPSAAAKPESTATETTNSSVGSKTTAASAADPALAAQPNGVNPNEYVIGDQDQLTIVVWGEPALSGPVAVRPDGKITVPLINEIKVTGMTPMQLQNLLTEKLKPFINMPQVTVVVRQINSRNVYLIGETGREGMFPINSSTTILQLIAEAGGLRDFAKRKGIYVLRNVHGKQVRLTFNYDQVIRGIHSEQNVVLQPGDTVVVP